jgi:outer membrane protein OmpA-like peptidoglycan-associated protein
VIALDWDGGLLGMTALYARSTAMFGAAVLMLIGTGCATKKHVRQTIGPVEARVSQAEKRNTEQQAAIGELGNSVSRADEHAMDAERKAREAGEAAKVAHTRADSAFGRADSAYSRADTANALAESTRARLTELSENIDNYKMVTAENILFRLNQHKLTTEAEQKLDAAVAQLQGSKNYVLEIQGFTDATGTAQQNLELSRKRADSVVRYLTVKHNVPLRKINVLGVGEDDPTADNKTREGRKAARRVEMRVFALDLGGQNAGGNMPRQTQTAQPGPTAANQ